MNKNEAESTAAAFARFFLDNPVEFERLAAVDRADISAARDVLPTGVRANSLAYAGFFAAHRDELQRLAALRPPLKRVAEVVSIDRDGREVRTW